jgi:Tfp pilus assembly protein PilF
MIFDDDLTRRNRVHCHYLIALGQLGTGRAAEAKAHLDQVLALDAAHQGAWVHSSLLQRLTDKQYSVL